MTSPILIFGAAGRVGSAIAAFASDRSDIVFDEATDITDAEELGSTLEAVSPSVVVNLAACTLPLAERPEALGEALSTNANAMRTFAAHRVPVVHISTDCVFDGSKAEPYAPEDAPNPVNIYGMTKRLGEAALDRTPHVIIRTTGIYLRNRPNFLETVLSKAKAGEGLEIVSDSRYSPTDARELARAILTAAERIAEDPIVSGTYHFAGPDVMSYTGFAELVLEEADMWAPIKGVTMAEREAIEGFKRPRNASLNSDKFASVFGLRHRPTRECVRELLNPA